MSLGLSIMEFARTEESPILDVLNTTPAVGIELEYEGFRNSSTALKRLASQSLWRITSDGSLRSGGVEFVSIPLLENQIEEALTVAEAIAISGGAQATPRCGLHTHMNMRPYNAGQVWSLATLYALIEPTVFATYAQGRVNSMFSVPLWANTQLLNSLNEDICILRNNRRNNIIRSNSTNTSKYSALNFHSLQTFGTLEMRQPYCSVNFEAIRSWVDFCFRLIKQGTSYNDPAEVLALYNTVGLRGLQETVFGEACTIEDDLQELAEDAAYMCCGFAEPTWQQMTWEIG